MLKKLQTLHKVTIFLRFMYKNSNKNICFLYFANGFHLNSEKKCIHCEITAWQSIQINIEYIEKIIDYIKNLLN